MQEGNDEAHRTGASAAALGGHGGSVNVNIGHGSIMVNGQGNSVVGGNVTVVSGQGHSVTVGSHNMASTGVDLGDLLRAVEALLPSLSIAQQQALQQATKEAKRTNGADPSGFRAAVERIASIAISVGKAGAAIVSSVAAVLAAL